jgi:hypothetical protein
VRRFCNGGASYPCCGQPGLYLVYGRGSPPSDYEGGDPGSESGSTRTRGRPARRQAASSGTRPQSRAAARRKEGPRHDRRRPNRSLRWDLCRSSTSWFAHDSPLEGAGFKPSVPRVGVKGEDPQFHADYPPYRVGPQTTHETHAQWVQALRRHLPGANSLPAGSARSFVQPRERRRFCRRLRRTAADQCKQL